MGVLLQPSLVTGGEENQLENDLVLKATVEVFVWEDNRVEYDHLGGDGHITA